MVKGYCMLISEFSRNAGMSVDTARYYVRCGLLAPEMTTKGGSNPYQIFAAEHVETARLIRVAQSLGFSLKEISALSVEYKKGGSKSRKLQDVLRLQIVKLQEKSDQLLGVIAYMKAKVDWIDAGSVKPEPRFGDYEKNITVSKRPSGSGLRRGRG